MLQRGDVKQRIARSVVFTVMTAMPTSSAKARSRRSIVVERPRAGDAIGGALRSAFGPDCGLPADMRQLLRQLDGAAQH